MGGLFHYSWKMGRRPKEAKRDPFGAWLHYLRKSAGISQQELSEKLRVELGNHVVGSASVCQWERKGGVAGKELIPALANALGVSLESLLRVQRGRDGKYYKNVADPLLEQKLQELGARKERDWMPPKHMPKGYAAQGPYNRKADNTNLERGKPPSIPDPVKPISTQEDSTT